MISVQVLTRNLRRIASLRGFSSAAATKNEDIKKTTNGSATKNAKTIDLFTKLQTLEDPSVIQAEVAKKSEPVNNLAEQQNELRIRISNSTSVSELLNLSESYLSLKNATLIITRLSTLTSSNQANVKDFENDSRFLRISRILSTLQTKSKTNTKPPIKYQSAELEMILSVSVDEDASRIIETLTLSQKVRVFSSLARKNTRNIIVLKTLASTINDHKEKLNLKECSDLLFAMNNLNFLDEVLLYRIGIDINNAIKHNIDKTAVVGSIVTSLGFLKFREPKLLDNLSEWVTEKQALCRPRDLSSLAMTLALVNYKPKNIDALNKDVLSKITRNDLSASEWLDFVWALSVLGLQGVHHLKSVLSPLFLNELILGQGTREALPAQKMKLLNIDAVAKQLTSNYDGSFLGSDSNVNDCPIICRKSKKLLIQRLLDTMKNLFNENSFIRTEHDTKFGFVIDVECAFNENRIPVAVESADKDAIKVALMVLDYNDVCRGENQPNGYNALAIKLLQKNGYHVLPIPYNEFSTSDNVLKRVQYLDSKLKNIIKL